MKKYKHNLSHYHLLTGDMGQLIPVATVEVLPGDTFQMSTSLLLRCSPLVAPVMHPVQVRVHHFFVPNRLIWSGWEDFITDANSGAVPPPVTAASGVTQPLANYLGIPKVAFTSVSSLPFRAYAKIFNDYYRDQEIDAEIALDQKDLQYCRWEKDYATAARIGPQRGDEAYALVSDNHVTARRMREALAEQRFLEARSRFGNRYTEYLQYLGIQPSDARLQRAEYLGGSKQTISFSEVLQTAEGATSPVGELKGHGIAAVRGNRFRRFFEEHGFVMSLLSVRPKAIYMRGLHKKWNRTDYNDYWQKELELQGQEVMYKREIAANGDAEDNNPFGWQDKDYSYRTEVSRVSGEFAENLRNFWHLGRDFTLQPQLNTDFLECKPSKRIYADEVNDGLLVMAQNNIKARRLVRRRSAPRAV